MSDDKIIKEFNNKLLYFLNKGNISKQKPIPKSYIANNVWPNAFRIDFDNEIQNINLNCNLILPNVPKGNKNNVYFWQSNNWYKDDNNNGIIQPVFEHFESSNNSNWVGAPLYYSPIENNWPMFGSKTIQWEDSWNNGGV